MQLEKEVGDRYSQQSQQFKVQQKKGCEDDKDDEDLVLWRNWYNSYSVTQK
jgi:hypothetical protein